MQTISLASRCVEAVHECDTDVDFSYLAVEVSGCEALAEYFEATHFRSDRTPNVVSFPELPEVATAVPGGAQGIVASPRS